MTKGARSSAATQKIECPTNLDGVKTEDLGRKKMKKDGWRASACLLSEQDLECESMPAISDARISLENERRSFPLVRSCRGKRGRQGKGERAIDICHCVSLSGRRFVAAL